MCVGGLLANTHRHGVIAVTSVALCFTLAELYFIFNGSSFSGVNKLLFNILYSYLQFPFKANINVPYL
jgi:hypothetical protein